jgi:phasin family protein
MYNATEQFSELNKANYDNVMKLASLSIEKAERLLNLNVQSAKLALAQSMTGASAVAEVKDPQDFFALRAKLAEAGMQYATAYSRGVYEVASETQADFSALAEQAWSAYTKGIAAWVEKATQNAPAGSDVAVTAFKSGVAATTAAFDQFTKATKQVVNFADASVRAASANAVKASVKARKAA